MTWALIVVLGIGSYAVRYSGLAVAGRGNQRPIVHALLALIPPAILAGLITIQTFSGDGSYAFDARVPGVAAAVVAAGFRRPFLVVVLIAVGVTVALRAVGWE